MKFYCASCGKHKPTAEMIMRGKQKRCAVCNANAAANSVKSKAAGVNILK